MSPEAELVEVRLLAVPLVLRERSRQQGADLLREMTLLQAGLHHEDDHSAASSGGAGGQVPVRLQRLARELEEVYGPYVAASSVQMDEAVDRGESSLDVTYALPATAAAFLHRVRELLAEVEEYCRGDDHLLTLAPPADIAAYRDWSIGQVLAQLAGAPPTPWPVHASHAGVA